MSSGTPENTKIKSSRFLLWIYLPLLVLALLGVFALSRWVQNPGFQDVLSELFWYEAEEPVKGKVHICDPETPGLTLEIRSLADGARLYRGSVDPRDWCQVRTASYDPELYSEDLLIYRLRFESLDMEPVEMRLGSPYLELQGLVYTATEFSRRVEALSPSID